LEKKKVFARKFFWTLRDFLTLPTFFQGFQEFLPPGVADFLGHRIKPAGKTGTPAAQGRQPSVGLFLFAQTLW
jgi:hypothetical protein